MTDGSTLTTDPAAEPVAEQSYEPTTLAPAAPAAAPKHRRWPIWVAAAAIAVLIFGTGVRVGFGVANRFGVRSMRAGFTAAAVQRARGFAPGGRGFVGGPGFRR